jgi:hypothetical protein
MTTARNSRVLRTIPLLIAVCFASLPAYAKYSGGTGEPNDPYQIATAADLMLLGESPEDYDKHFILTANIDMDPNLSGRKVFDKAVIGIFNGVFAGNSHTISHLTITGGGRLGLFGHLGSKAAISNLALEAVDVYGTGASIGGLVGYNTGHVTTSYSTGVIRGNESVGGLVGGNKGNVFNCYSTTVVSGNQNVGGVVGYSNGQVVNCYSVSVVSGKQDAGGVVGGFGLVVAGGANWHGRIPPIQGCFSNEAANIRDIQTYLDAGWDFVGEVENGTSEIWQMPQEGDYPTLATFSGYKPPHLRGMGTSEDPYLISSALELGAMASYSSCAHYQLVASIDLVGIQWSTAVIPYFDGTFDGNDLTISNLTIRGGGCLGLFGRLGCGGEVKKLGVLDVYLGGNFTHIGGLVGYNAGAVNMCYSSGQIRGFVFVGGVVGENYATGTVTSSYSISAVEGKSHVGGLVGHSSGWAIDCYNAGEINSSFRWIGGLVGRNEGYVSRCRNTGTVIGDWWGIGGLVGYNLGRITSCYNNGTVTAGEDVGGLVGCNDGGLTGCYSTGSVTGDKDIGGLVGSSYGRITNCYITGTVSGKNNVGGLVGSNGSAWGGESETQITKCYSTGMVSGVERVGGLVGRNYGTVTNCYNLAIVTGEGVIGGLVGKNGYLSQTIFGPSGTGGTISNSYSAGAVVSTYSAGGLVGSHEYGAITSSFWDIQISGQAESGGGTGLTTADMQATATFLDAGWDFIGETKNGSEDIWWILEGRNYPRLRWELWPSCPDPPDGATDVVQSPILSWHSATTAAEHDVYFGGDEEAVADATPESLDFYCGRQSLKTTTYQPGHLEWDKTYYWRIDGVNEADPDSPWKGSVWSFTTANFVVVDDFESYNDYPPYEIYSTWLDGYGDPTNGSQVGYLTPPLVETTIFHGGQQSMPMDYNNVDELYYSEAERTWETPQDWTIDGTNTLTLYFRGEANNNPEPLYVAIQDSAGQIAVVAHPDAGAVFVTEWQQWDIAFSDLQATGVDVASVKKMYIGVGDRDNPQPGGTGRIYIDDIRLTKRML